MDISKSLWNWTINEDQYLINRSLKENNKKGEERDRQVGRRKFIHQIFQNWTVQVLDWKTIKFSGQ